MVASRLPPYRIGTCRSLTLHLSDHASVSKEFRSLEFRTHCAKGHGISVKPRWLSHPSRFLTLPGVTDAQCLLRLHHHLSDSLSVWRNGLRGRV